MRDQLLESPVIHCDETRAQALKEPDRIVVLLDYSSDRAQDVPLRLLENYRGYVMTDDYASYNALA